MSKPDSRSPTLLLVVTGCNLLIQVNDISEAADLISCVNVKNKAKLVSGQTYRSDPAFVISSYGRA